MNEEALPCCVFFLLFGADEPSVVVSFPVPEREI